MDNKYFLLRGCFYSFSINNGGCPVILSEPYVIDPRVWYKPWTWFKKFEVIMPDPIDMVLEVQGDNITFYLVNDYGGFYNQKLLLTPEELQKVRSI